MSDYKTNAQASTKVAIAVAIITCLGTVLAAVIAKLPAHTSTPVFIVVTETPVSSLTSTASTDIPVNMTSSSAINEAPGAKLYILGYTSGDVATHEAIDKCKGCQVLYLSSLNDLPADWYHYAFNVASTTANIADDCRTKQELINLGVTLLITNNYTPCTTTYDVSKYDVSNYAILVGVSNKTEFSLADAANYTYVANMENMDEAISELSKVFVPNDLVSVAHVPNLRATPGNPGSCKLYFRDIERLKEYPLGWIIGGNNIIPSQFQSNLEFCFGNTDSSSVHNTSTFSPLASDYISVKGYVGVVSSGGVPGTRIYSHLVTGTIKYERVEADDDVTKVELVCGDGQITDITGNFFLIGQPAGSYFPNYSSNEIGVPANCRVDFTVADTGGQTGITIRSAAVP